MKFMNVGSMKVFFYIRFVKVKLGEVSFLNLFMFVTDFLLIVLKDLLPRRPELRLVLMSATLDAELFSSYFSGAPRVHIPVSLWFIFPLYTYYHLICRLIHIC